VSRSRHKLDTSPLDYDEARESSVMAGMVSFLEIPVKMPDKGAPERGIPLKQKQESEVQPGSPNGSIPNYAPKGMGGLRRKIVSAQIAQDGHSLGEQALYEALWKAAHPHEKETRIITIGYRQMAEAARMTVNNCKANIQSLIQKLAIEEVSSFTHTQGRTYLLYSYKVTLRRREAAGLTHCIRTRGVVFVDPITGEPITARVRDISGIPLSGTSLPAVPVPGVPEKGDKGTPLSDKSGIPLSDMYPYRQKERHLLETTTSVLPEIAELGQEIRQLGVSLDDEALEKLWSRCRRHAPDCTAAEILHFVQSKAGILRRGNISNAAGFLLISIPKCFVGAGFQAYRQGKVREEEPEPGSDEMYRSILEDANAADYEREAARQILEAKR
jgi:hypothetical protein